VPKIVDRVEQRREIGAALLRVVVRDGMEQVSVRTVAAEAGRSAGAVQKYFATKDDLLRFALDLADGRVAERFAGVDQRGPVLDVLRRYLRAFLPLDDERRAEVLVRTAFAEKGVRDDQYAHVLRDADRHVGRVLADMLERSGEVRHDVDPLVLADAVLALADGVAARMLYTRDQDEALLLALDVALSGLLQPPQR
jgi:AcrR family transcriptional regulator